ncbi:MAG: hypothetical protein D6683_17675 [Actinomyces sp.]|nr:MAG: hypothetical protein D6683_17675 [Actinomyces sp.]
MVLVLLTPAVLEAKSAVFTVYGTVCQIKVSGFEYWGRAASSTRDHTADCSYIRTRVRYKDSSNNYNYLTGSWTLNEYTRKVAGWGTDWDWASGGGNGVSTWYTVVR